MKQAHFWPRIKVRRSLLIVVSCLSLVFSFGCQPQSYQNNTNQSVRPQANQSADILNTKQLSISSDRAFIPAQAIKGVRSISLEDLVTVLQLRAVWNQNKTEYSVGENGADTILTVGSRTAKKGDATVVLMQAPFKKDDKIYLSMEDALMLFGDTGNFQKKPSGIEAIGKQVENLIDTNEQNFFQDDPDDPYADGTALLDKSIHLTSNAVAAVSLKNINMNLLIQTAKRYLGVKYLFGAAPYPQSKRFDCSSYTKYIFGKQGVTLKRTARAQGWQGNAVSRKKLRTGDLLFFYVPGRFKTNKVVGHVGIYLGNGKMIHSSRIKNKGVQISGINNSWWKKTFLKARRIAM